MVSGPAALRPFAVAALARKRTVLAVTSTGREAEDLADALRCLIPPDQVAVYPGWETLPHERLSPRADTVGQRLAVLRRLAHPSTDDPTTGPLRVVVAPIRSVLQPQVPGLGELEPVALHAGDTARELTDIVHDLVAAGYARTELVERRGDFVMRGGILDVFPPTEEHPLRVEFWGDEVEESRQLDGGLVAPTLKLACLTEAYGTGQRGSLTNDSSRLSSRRRNAIDPIPLRPGDFVVHEQHGSRYAEMVRRTVNGGEWEYLIIEHELTRRGQPGDRLHAPTDSLDQVTKYVGRESLTINCLGGAGWAMTMSRTGCRPLDRWHPRFAGRRDVDLKDGPKCAANARYRSRKP